MEPASARLSKMAFPITLDAAHRGARFRFWVLGAVAVLLSAGAAFTLIQSTTYAIIAAVSAGVGPKENIAWARHWSTDWWMVSVCCLGVSSLAGALATPIYKETGWLFRLVARLVAASVVSLVLAVLIVLVFYSLT